MVYDSAATSRSVGAALADVFARRGLVRLLITREITLRYKRSVLGVWWTLLNPLLSSVVLWVVFNNIFRFSIPGRAPYIVYLLSGVTVGTLFSQGVLAVGGSLVANAGLLSKVFVPAEIFAIATASASLVNAFAALIPLLVLQLALGVGIPLTAPLVLVPLVLLFMFVTGLGLIVAVFASEYRDIFDVTAFFVTLLGFMTPTFYPVSVFPAHLRVYLHLNPIYNYLVLVRQTIYEGKLGEPLTWGAAVLTTVVALALGLTVMARTRQRVALLL